MNISKILILILIISGNIISSNLPDTLLSAVIIPSKSNLIGKDTILLAVKTTIKNEWHIYWTNPGDNGLATSFEWSLPDGFEIHKAPFPYPKRFISDGMTNFGYSDSIYFLFTLVTPETLQSKSEYQISCTIDYLACKDICIPGTASLKTVFLKIEEMEKPEALNTELFSFIKSKIPVDYPGIQITATQDGNDILFTGFSDSSDKIIMQLEFFPVEQGLFLYTDELKIVKTELKLTGNDKTKNGFQFRVPLDPLNSGIPKTFNIVLYNPNGFDNSGKTKAIKKQITINQ